MDLCSHVFRIARQFVLYVQAVADYLSVVDGLWLARCRHPQPELPVIMEKLKQVAKTVRRSLKPNYLLTGAMICFMFLYLHDHSKLQEYQQQPTEKTVQINHRERLRARHEIVRRTCSDFNNSLRLENKAFYYEEKMSNPCTGTHFQVKQRSHFLCNVLKGGSTSWEMFFAENKIVNTKGRSSHLSCVTQ